MSFRDELSRDHRYINIIRESIDETQLADFVLGKLSLLLLDSTFDNMTGVGCLQQQPFTKKLGFFMKIYNAGIGKFVLKFSETGKEKKRLV